MPDFQFVDNNSLGNGCTEVADIGQQELLEPQEKDWHGFTKTLEGNSKEFLVLVVPRVLSEEAAAAATLLADAASAAPWAPAQLLSPFSEVQYKLICQNIQESSLY